MKLLVFTGLIIILISIFPIVHIFEGVIKDQVGCLNESEGCDIREFGVSMMAWLLLSGVLIIIDGTVVYLIVRHVIFSEGRLLC